MFISKTKFVLALLAMTLIVPATAFATDAWPDTEDGKFYHDAVTWAKGNGMTTGCDGGTNFCPDRGVTRGENITFAKRYDDLVVQPALTAVNADIATNTAAIAGVPTTYWAWVSNSGALYTGTSSDGVSASKGVVGEYVVTFPVDVSGCSWSVAHRSVDGLILILDPDFEDDVFFDLSTRTTGFLPSISHPTDIRVRVFEAGGTAATTNFNLQVTCFPT